jgi:hypothetical protein
MMIQMIESTIEHWPSVAAGLRAAGASVRTTDCGHGAAASWGWKRGKRFRALTGRDVIVFERGYIGDRFKYTSIALNGLNGHATFPRVDAIDTGRFDAHGGVLKPWRDDGDYILITGQVPGDASLGGRNLTSWYEGIARSAERRYGKSAYFRAHPDGRKRFNPRIRHRPLESLADALEGAFMTITFNSNSALDSVMAGVPCFAGDVGTMAWPMCSHDVNERVFPARREHCDRIAHLQWSVDEIESGEALRPVLEMLQ